MRFRGKEMGNTVAELITVLSEKEAIMNELIGLLKQEQRSIVDIDLPGMELADEKKRAMLVKLEDSNNRFRQILKDAAAELDVAEAANLTCLLPRIGSSQRSALQGLQARLLELGANLDRTLLFNRELLQGSLRTVNRSLDFFQGLFRRSTTYGHAGGMVSSSASARLVCKEI